MFWNSVLGSSAPWGMLDMMVPESPGIKSKVWDVPDTGDGHNDDDHNDDYDHDDDNTNYNHDSDNNWW